MAFYKKFHLLALCISILNADVAPVDTGKARIEALMAHPETGITSYNKAHITYADSLSLSQDLNVPEIAKYFDCKTVIGNSFMVETLKSPVSPENIPATVLRRQQIIRALVENPALKAEIEMLLNQAQAHEQDLVTLMSEGFIGKTCPELKNLELIRKQNPVLAPLLEFITLNPTGRIIGLGAATFQLAQSVGTGALCAVLAYKQAQWGMDYTQMSILTTMCGAAAAIEAYNLKKDYSQASEKRSKLHALNQLIAIAEQVETQCQNYGIETQFKISDIKDTNGKKLVQGLKNSRYKDKKTLFFFHPPVHTFLYQVYREEKHLAELFACIAEMDAYNAIASKMLTTTEKNKFCFATFINQDKPAVRAQKFWNVLVEKVISSSLAEERNILLTGPNAGGKTTAIRAILQNLVLGQTFGIAAAESFEFTPFNVIHSYLNISDDLLNGLSLFASEVKRAKDILSKIKALEPNKKYFFALDELFTGTAAEDGEVCAYEFVKKIASFENVQFIYATHFNKLKELGTESLLCANYKVDAPTKNAAGKLVYPFTLSAGANQSRVALDIAREANLFD